MALPSCSLSADGGGRRPRNAVRRRTAPPPRPSRSSAAAWRTTSTPTRGAGDQINYATPIATASGTAWTSGTLAASGTWSFGVRAFDGNGEEENLDCAVAIVLDGNGNDITNRPAPPIGLRAFATANASIRVEWGYPPTTGAKAPTQFNVYIGTGGTPNYAAPVATVAFNAVILSTFVTNLTSLTGGTTYSIGVRAYNACGTETNTIVVNVTADATGPAAVDSLVATAIV